MTTRDNSQANENRGDSARQAPTDGSLVIRSLDSHVVRAPTYIVRDWRGLGVFPVGATVVAGKQGSGKSTFLRKILSDFTSGSGSFRGEQVGNILYTCWEDDPGESILPEVAMNGGDLRRIHFLTGVRQGSTRRQWQMDDLERIEDYCAENSEVKIIVVDTLTSLSNTIGRNTRGARAAGMVTTALHQLGQRLGIAVVIVCHLTKYNRRGGALDAIAGSTELTSGPRAVWLVGRNPRNERYRSMVLVKHNLTGLSSGCTFSTAPVDLAEAIETLRARGLRTEGELPESMFLRTEILREEELPSADAVYQASVNIGSETRVTALDQTVAFIREIMRENGGCVATSVLQDRATLEGFSAATLMRARNQLREDGEIQTFQRGREHFVAESGFDRETFVAIRRDEGSQGNQPEEGFGAASPQNSIPQLPPGGQYQRRLDI